MLLLLLIRISEAPRASLPLNKRGIDPGTKRFETEVKAAPGPC